MKTRRDRTGLHTLLFFVTLATIPFYLLGMGLWLFAPQKNQTTPPGQMTNTPASSDEDPTWTPLNSDGSGGITPVIATGFPTLTTAPTLDFNFGQPTALPFVTFTPMGGFPGEGNFGGPATLVGSTPAFFTSPTPIPTRFLTATFTTTPAVTDTPPAPAATNTSPAPPPTQPPLIPPTDTPGA